MCSSDEKQSRSPLALYSEYQRMDIELRPPHAMPTSHWHGQWRSTCRSMATWSI